MSTGPAPSALLPNSRAATVLIVDDELVSVMWIVRLMEGLGYRVGTASMPSFVVKKPSLSGRLARPARVVRSPRRWQAA